MRALKIPFKVEHLNDIDVRDRTEIPMSNARSAEICLDVLGFLVIEFEETLLPQSGADS